jgi:hypothetical protein
MLMPQNLSIAELKAKISELFSIGMEFDKTLSRLERLRAVAQQDPARYARFNELAARGGAVKAAISNAVGRVQSVYDWVKANLGVNLGVLPLVPIAIVGVVITAIAAAQAWISEASAEARRLEIIASLPVEQRAKALAAQAAAPTWSGNLASMAMWIAIAGIAIYVVPKLLKARQ